MSFYLAYIAMVSICFYLTAKFNRVFCFYLHKQYPTVTPTVENNHWQLCVFYPCIFVLGPIIPLAVVFATTMVMHGGKYTVGYLIRNGWNSKDGVNYN